MSENSFIAIMDNVKDNGLCRIVAGTHQLLSPLYLI